MKALYVFLQASCIAVSGNRVAVFLRPEQEAPTKKKKLTIGPEMIRSWLPESTTDASISRKFAFKTGFTIGRAAAAFEPFGLAYNELTNFSKGEPGPAYLFVLWKVHCDEAAFTDGAHGGSEMKSGERLLGFYDVGELYEHRAKYQGRQIEFAGTVDQIVLEGLAKNRDHVCRHPLACWHRKGHLVGKPLSFKRKVVGPGSAERNHGKLMHRLEQLGISTLGGILARIIENGAVLSLKGINSLFEAGSSP